VYFRDHATKSPERVAIVHAATGDTITYAELEARSNQAAQLFRSLGLHTGDHIAVVMENNPHLPEVIAGAVRSGLYYTPVNSHLTAPEIAYIIADCAARVVLTTKALLDVMTDVVALCPDVRHWYVVDTDDPPAPFSGYRNASESASSQPISDERLGSAMMYSSGTTGRPKGILRPLAGLAPEDSDAAVRMGRGLMKFRPGMTTLIPAPLYHSAPHAALAACLQLGGTAVVMARFDAHQVLALTERHRVTHVQVVPTMFTRLLALPDVARTEYDLSSLEAVVHSAAPCPIPVKQQMIDWLGPIIYEYYGATESYGFTRCTSQEWLAHKGTVGRAALGEIRILDDAGMPCAPGEVGTVWFVGGSSFSYVGQAAKKSADTGGPPGGRSVGDVGYLDADGYLYLTDRKDFMIVSGGVNIYPQEVEDALMTFDEIEDAAVIGIPHEDFGEQVKAVVVLKHGCAETPDLAERVIAHCRERLASFKCPRSVDVVDALPRLETGKLAKHVIRDRYRAPAHATAAHSATTAESELQP
jgi:acyl-CoA synthetase (AMP-forming)/AMP-acid ligase II